MSQDSWEVKLGMKAGEADLGRSVPSLSSLPSLPSSPSPEAESTTQEASFESAQVEKLARENLDFLAALAMPLIFRYCFPTVFKSIWTWLLSYAHKTRIS